MPNATVTTHRITTTTHVAAAARPIHTKPLHQPSSCTQRVDATARNILARAKAMMPKLAPRHERAILRFASGAGGGAVGIAIGTIVQGALGGKFMPHLGELAAFASLTGAGTACFARSAQQALCIGAGLGVLSGAAGIGQGHASERASAGVEFVRAKNADYSAEKLRKRAERHAAAAQEHDQATLAAHEVVQAAHKNIRKHSGEIVELSQSTREEAKNAQKTALAARKQAEEVEQAKKETVISSHSAHTDGAEAKKIVDAMVKEDLQGQAGLQAARAKEVHEGVAQSKNEADGHLTGAIEAIGAAKRSADAMVSENLQGQAAAQATRAGREHAEVTRSHGEALKHSTSATQTVQEMSVIADQIRDVTKPEAIAQEHKAKRELDAVKVAAKKTIGHRDSAFQWLDVAKNAARELLKTDWWGNSILRTKVQNWTDTTEKEYKAIKDSIEALEQRVKTDLAAKVEASKNQGVADLQKEKVPG